MAQPETSLPKLTSVRGGGDSLPGGSARATGELPQFLGERENVVRPITCVLILLIAGSVEAQVASKQADAKETTTLNLTAYAELLRSDVRAQKVAIITEVMNFTEAEDKVFWPIYREFDLEMAKLGDERVAMIAEYARNYSNLTDAMADKLAGQALDLEARRQALKAKYLRSPQDGAVAAHGPALFAGRASTAAADRSPDLGRASHREVTGDQNADPNHSFFSCGHRHGARPRDGRVALRGPCPVAVGKDRGRHVHGRGQ